MIRIAEKNKGVFNVSLDMKIKLKDSIHISQHIGSLCYEAPDTTFTSKDDIDKWTSVPGNSILDMVPNVYSNIRLYFILYESKFIKNIYTFILITSTICY